MSNTYPNYPGSSFPDEIDKLIRMSDLTPADIPLVNQYYEYFNSGNLESANSILLANPDLNTKFFNAAKFNKIIDSVLCMENFFVDNVQGYIDTKQGEFNAKVDAFIYKGAYSASEDYVPKNIVYYSGCSYVCRVACRGVTPAAGSTSANWGLIAQKGDQGIQGASGTGLAPRGLWNALTEYYAEDCVAHRNAIWQCVSTNINSTPDESNERWLKLMEVNLTSVNQHIEDLNIHVTSEDKTKWNGKQDALTIDESPTKDSSNPVSSGGVFSALNQLSPTPFHAGTSQPSNIKLLWIDTTPVTGGLKYYDGSNWVPVPVRYTTT